MRAEELAAVIEERPGKLLKLATALAFIAGALAARLLRVAQISTKTIRLWIHLSVASWKVLYLSVRTSRTERKMKKLLCELANREGKGKSSAAAAAALLVLEGGRKTAITMPEVAGSQEALKRAELLLRRIPPNDADDQIGEGA
ncbi:hypothetical protein [[Actinomadura] parvosata]|uniref:hypothetical protein n=1 Tax=[Actinomadura] parvosata TaxID=1955412 RepID=UPI0012BD1A42|nr:hypothetical protein [Nonomuraea sp. ATCC 55076]